MIAKRCKSLVATDFSVKMHNRKAGKNENDISN